MKTNRREFLRSSLFAAATCAAAPAALAELSNPQPNPRPSTPSGKLIDSAPMLQNPAPTSMGVAFAVSAMANGFVELSESPDMKDARKVRSGGFRVTGLDPRVQLVRLTGLKEATRYYYRIGADRIRYEPIRSKILGTEIDPAVRSFTTSGAKADSSFCAINDTHIQWEPLDLVLGKTEELKPAVLIHLGDASETMPTVESQVEMFLAPPVKNNAYAAERGVLFCPGNHDQWGFANRTLERVFMFRQPEERSSRDWDLGRNFAFRQGDIALIGLDTGIHWRDDYPQAGGVFANDAYRVAQTRWLAEVLERPDIKSAPYIVANCHVPVYDRKEDPVRIDWQRAWGELFTKAGVQVVLVGHTHVYRYDPPAAGRTWAQIVGGSPNMELPDFPDRWPTVMHGRVEKGALRITVHDALYKRIAGDFTYMPRTGR